MEGSPITKVRLLDEMTRKPAKQGRKKKRREPSTEIAPGAWEPVGRFGRKV